MSSLKPKRMSSTESARQTAASLGDKTGTLTISHIDAAVPLMTMFPRMVRAAGMTTMTTTQWTRGGGGANTPDGCSGDDIEGISW